MDNSVIAKSGWLYRQILKKWQKNWVELYRDGHLKYYETECSPNAEDTIFMPTECLAIKAGLQVEAVQPPDGYGIHNLLSIITSTGKTWIFCGESSDDMRAWQLALEQARLFGMHPQMSAQAPQYMAAYNPGFLSAYGGDSSLPYMPQFAYPPPAYYGYPGLQYMSTAPGQAALVYQPERYIRPDGSDVGLGMLGSPAVGPLSWGPLLWW
ncbi:pleckstrin homology domain-containing family B member 2-like isoform X2 [Uloborus diversus]|uniref:pleckstrin homology domain-containing family B member 2-like isoform X2 n=1 Tax=Uloborus diversus TaxID=327109 RepID=UPI00240A7B66|nr:pleckstrin homology domain-containing family B member 2-like isoform X2 [Uloborus diversus]